MTAEAKHLLEDFDKLSDPEKREVLSELLHAAQLLEYPAIPEEQLISAANDLFLEYDRREAHE